MGISSDLCDNLIGEFKNAKAPASVASVRYAKGLLEGSIPANQDIILAAKRYIDDFYREDAPYYYCIDSAERAASIADHLPHPKGKWASMSNKRNTIKNEPWQKFFYTNIFGWVDTETGYRRFTEAFLFVPRKNAKSVMAASTAIIVFNESLCEVPEIYVGAASESQAYTVFNMIRTMFLKRPDLSHRLGVTVGKAAITTETDASCIKPVIGKPGDSASPKLWVCDEYHEHPTDSQYETAISGMGAREEPLLLVTTTAGNNISYPCYNYWNKIVRMLRGEIPMLDHLFAMVYAVDLNDDLTKLESWVKANPNYGVSVNKLKLKTDVEIYRSDLTRRNSILTKHGNVWVNSARAWLDLNDWGALSDKELKLENFRGDFGVLGLDLTRKLDFFAEVYTFFREIDGFKHYFFIPFFYLPAKTIEDPSNQHYQKWVETGYLVKIPGAEINDHLVIERIDEHIRELGGIDEIAIDPNRASNFFKHYEEHPACFEFAQRPMFMSPAMREFESALAGARVHHDGNPILMWMLGNVEVKETPGEIIFPRKANAKAKIDGVTALLMGVNRCMMHENQETSIERQGVVVL